MKMPKENNGSSSSSAKVTKKIVKRKVDQNGNASGKNTPVEIDEEDQDVPENYITRSTLSSDERRKQRQKYTEIQEDLTKNHHDFINPASEGLQNALRKVDEIYKDVEQPREAVKDSQTLVQIAHLGRLKAQALQTDFVNFQPVEFAEKLVSYISGQRIDDSTSNLPRISAAGWQEFGKAVQPFFRKVPPLKCMLGTFQLEPRQKKDRNVRRPEKETVAERTVPQQLKSVGGEKSQQTTFTEMTRIYELLDRYCKDNGCDSLDFFEFVINPHSYGHTIENIFHVAFLVKDGYVSIELDEDKLPVIKPIKKEEGAEEPPENQRNHQVIMSLTKKEWRALKETYEIDDPLIPPHEELEPGPGGKGDSEEPQGKGKGKGKKSNPKQNGTVTSITNELSVADLEEHPKSKRGKKA